MGFRDVIFCLALGLVLGVGQVWGQEVISMDTERLFRKNHAALVATLPDSGLKVLTSNEDSADVLESSEFPTVKGGADIYVVGRVVEQLGDSVNSKLQVGLYRGEGTHTAGWEWVDVLDFDAEEELDSSLQKLAAVAEKPFSKYKLRIVETGAQQNRYVFWVHRYQAGGR